MNQVFQALILAFGMFWQVFWSLILGFLISGLIGIFVPNSFWNLLFLKGTSATIQFLISPIVGPLIAILTFVCSIGNVPLAAILWSQGLSFGGVLAFLYADLIVIPLLDVYRKYYGLKMAGYIGIIFFQSLNLVPTSPHLIHTQLSMFSLNYTFFLNIIFGIIGGLLFYLNSL